MKIEKIEKISKYIKEYLNNIDAIGIYYNWCEKHKPVEIQLSFDRFYRLFKNYLKNANLEFENNEKHYITKISKIKNSFGAICLQFNIHDYTLSYKIGNIKYFTFLKGVDEIKKVLEAVNYV